jgi:hypothetical protein
VSDKPQWYEVRPGSKEAVLVDGPRDCFAPSRCSCCGTLDWTDEQLVEMFGRAGEPVSN